MCALSSGAWGAILTATRWLGRGAGDGFTALCASVSLWRSLSTGLGLGSHSVSVRYSVMRAAGGSLDIHRPS